VASAPSRSAGARAGLGTAPDAISHLRLCMLGPRSARDFRFRGPNRMTRSLVCWCWTGGLLAGGWHDSAQVVRGRRAGCGSRSSRCCRRSSVGFRHPGRRRLGDRKALCGILFVLYTGIPWEFLPQELGYGSGMTCCRTEGAADAQPRRGEDRGRAVGRIPAQGQEARPVQHRRDARDDPVLGRRAAGHGRARAPRAAGCGLRRGCGQPGPLGLISRPGYRACRPRWRS